MRILKASTFCGLLAASVSVFLYSVGAFAPLAVRIWGNRALEAGPLPQWIGAIVLAFGLAWTTVDIDLPILKWVVAVIALTEAALLAWLLHLGGVVWPPFTALCAGVLGTAAGAVYTYSDAGSRKRTINALFGGRISRSTARALLESDQPLHFSGERVVATVVVCKVLNSHLLAEALPAGDYAALINRFFAQAGTLLVERGGTLIPSDADTVCAVFGSPVNDSDHATLACEAALALDRQLVAFSDAAFAQSQPPLACGIGVNSGELTVAAFGAGDLACFGVAGQPLEFARRLCAANALYGCRLLLGPEAFRLANEVVEVRPVELIRVPGEKAPLEIYELLASAGQLTEAERERRDLFWRGVILFRSGRRAAAAVDFEAAASASVECGRGADALAQFYLRRIAQSRLGTPITDWASEKL